MAKLPNSEAFGERPQPVMARRTPMIATLRPTSGFEESASQEQGRSSQELEQASRIAIQAKEQQDNLRTEDAINQLRAKQVDMTFGKDGFANLKGGNAVNRPILKEYGGAFDKVAADLSGTLDNDYQKQLFQRRAAVSGMQLREDIGRHILTENNVYAKTVYDSRLDVESKAAAARWQSPDAATVPMLNIENMINQRARVLGLDGEEGKAWAQDQRQKAESTVYTNMVRQALTSDPSTGPFAARALLKAHGDVINPDTRAVLEHEVTLAVGPVEQRATAQAAIKTVVPRFTEQLQIGGSPVVDLVARVISAESGGNPAAVGPETATGKRSLGLMQLQPGTAEQMAVKLGLPYDEKRLTTDAAYNQQLGTEYLNQMMTRYGGNQTLAVAAYNAGPRRVDEWVAKYGDPRTGSISNADFAAKIPFAETKNYVSKILGGDQPAQQNKTDTLALMGQAISEGERNYLATHPGDLVGADRVTQYIKSYFGTIAQMENAEQNKNYQTLVKGLVPQVGPGGNIVTTGQDGKPLPTPSFSSLMQNPDWARAYNGLSIPQQDGVQSHLRRLEAEAMGRPMKEDGDTLEKVSTLISKGEITNKNQLLPYLNHGLGTVYFRFAENLLDEQASVNGVKLNTAIERQRRSAVSTLRRSMVGSVMPEAADDAAEQYFLALQNKVDQYKNSNPPKDVGSLFRPDTPDSMVKREVVMSFMRVGPNEAVKQAAGKNAPLPEPKDMKGMNDAQADAAFEALPAGSPYIAPNGTKMRKPGVYAPTTETPAAPAAEPKPAAAPKAPNYESFIKSKSQRGSQSYYVDAPARSPAGALSGKSYATRDEALAALHDLYGEGR